MLTLPDTYAALMARLQDQTIFGVVVDDSPMLRDLVRLGAEIAEKWAAVPTEAVRRIELLVLGNLAGTFTFNNVDLELGAEFPDSLPLPDRERYVLCRRRTTDHAWLEYLASNRYSAEAIPRLSTQLAARVGDCPIYMLTLAFILVSCGLCERAVLVAKPPHAWLACWIKGDNSGEPRHLDLSVRSHGKREEDMLDYYAQGFATALAKITIWPLEE